MKEQSNSIIKTVPAAEALRKVPQFNPLRYLRQTTSLKTGEPVLKFDLRYKKMWFRLACSDGRMVLNPMRITDTMANFEAQVYLHRDDPRPITNFISTMYAKNVPGGRYVQAAQDEALNEALDNAGFGIQLSDLVEPDSENEYGSEIPVAQARELLKKQVVQPVPEKKSTANHKVAEPVPQKVEDTSTEQVVDTVEHPVEAPTIAPEPEPGPVEIVPEELPQQPPEPVHNNPVNETAGVLEMLGVTQPESTTTPDLEATAVEPTAENTVSAEEQPAPGNTYTDDMTIEEITQRMTVDEARAIVVTFGTCKGWTLGDVMERRASSLRFYLYSAKDAGNVLKAAASLLLDELAMKKAG